MWACREGELLVPLWCKLGEAWYCWRSLPLKWGSREGAMGKLGGWLVGWHWVVALVALLWCHHSPLWILLLPWLFTVLSFPLPSSHGFLSFLSSPPLLSHVSFALPSLSNSEIIWCKVHKTKSKSTNALWVLRVDLFCVKKQTNKQGESCEYVWLPIHLLCYRYFLLCFSFFSNFSCSRQNFFSRRNCLRYWGNSRKHDLLLFPLDRGACSFYTHSWGCTRYLFLFVFVFQDHEGLWVPETGLSQIPWEAWTGWSSHTKQLAGMLLLPTARVSVGRGGGNFFLPMCLVWGLALGVTFLACESASSFPWTPACLRV